MVANIIQCVDLRVEAIDGAIERLAECGVLLVNPPKRFLQKLAVRDIRLGLYQLM